MVTSLYADNDPSKALIWPVPSVSKFTTAQDFGEYYKGIKQTHLGLDILARNAGVVAASDGIAYSFPLPDSKKNNCYGNYIVIDHLDGYATVYAHLSTIDIKPTTDLSHNSQTTSSINNGISVNQGDPIGVSGNTAGKLAGGYGCNGKNKETVGYHLHFELRKVSSLAQTSKERFKVKAPYSYEKGRVNPSDTPFRDPKLYFSDHIKNDIYNSFNDLNGKAFNVTNEGIGSNVRIGPSNKYAIITTINKSSDLYYHGIRVTNSITPECPMGWIQIKPLNNKWFIQPDGDENRYGWICSGANDEIWIHEVQEHCNQLTEFSNSNHQKVTGSDIENCIYTNSVSDTDKTTDNPIASNENDVTPTTKQPVAYLSGTWSGYYFYQDYKPAVKFNMNIVENNGAFSGVVTEPNSFSTQEKTLTANINGERVESTFEYVKIYDGSDGYNHSVNYQGSINEDKTTIQGNWNINKYKGTFKAQKTGSDSHILNSYDISPKISQQELFNIITNYYNNEGQWAGKYLLDKIEKTRIEPISETMSYVHVNYLYIPATKGNRASGRDNRKFMLTKNNNTYTIEKMYGANSAKF